MGMIWICRGRTLAFPRPLVMGIVNVTPDSFSDGGRFHNTDAAINHALQLIADGADILDIGGESTRPGAEPVPLAEELARVLPVVRGVAKQTTVPISIDTMKPDVARQAIECGACIVNDVSGLRDPAMIRLCSETAAGVIVNHMQGTPADMQAAPAYVDVVQEVDGFFAERLGTLAAAGIPPEAVCLDPGVGFGKTLPHTLEQLRRLATHQRHNRPVCLGVSRKGFLGQITGRERHERLAATLAVNCFALARGAAQVLRVHDVAAHRDAVLLHEQIGPLRKEPR